MSTDLNKGDFFKPLVPTFPITYPDERTILVAPSYPSPYNGFISAVNYCNETLNPTFENPAQILMAAGVYNETTTETTFIQSGTSIQGSSGLTCQISWSNPTADYPFITIEEFAELSEMQLSASRITWNDPTGGGIPAPPLVDNTLISMPNNAGALVCRTLSCLGAATCFSVTGDFNVLALTGAWSIFNTKVLEFPAGPFTIFVYVKTDIAFHINASSRLAISGTCSITDDSVTLGLPGGPIPIDVGVVLQGGAIFNCTGLNFEGCTLNVECDEAESCNIVGGSWLNGTNGIKITDSEVGLYSIKTLGTSGIDIEITDSLSSVNSVGCAFETSRLILPANRGNIALQFYDDNLNNERGFHTIGNSMIGDIKYPAETFLGQGSTNSQGLTVYKFDGTLMTYEDVTTISSPADLTTVTLFDDLTADTDIFYIGNDEIFSGLRVDIATILANGTSNSLVFEYYDAGWTPMTVMHAQHFNPHGSYADIGFSVIEEQDIRFNNNITMGLFTVNTVSAYWIRIKILTTLTISPVINNFKIYGSSAVFESSGYLLMYGAARPKKEVPFDMSWIDAAGTNRPGDSTIYLSQNLYVNRVFNSYDQGDIATFAFIVPVTLDSSTPLVMEFAYLSHDASAAQADFQFDLVYACSDETDILYDSTAAGVPVGTPVTVAKEKTITFNLPVNQIDGRQKQLMSIDVDLSECRASSEGEIIQSVMFRLERNVDSNGDKCVFLNLGFYQTTYILGLAKQI
jgi:hypothetical protein